MGLSGVLGAALSGLRVTSSNLELVAHNISNADTPGYTRRIAGQVEAFNGSQLSGARVIDPARALDQIVSRQLQLETSGLGYATVISQYSAQLDVIFGQPGGPSALDTLMNNLRGSLEELATSPESFLAQENTLHDAQVLANTLNSMSADIQSLRREAERGLDAAVTRVNELLTSISEVNTELSVVGQETPPAGLLDQRDQLINELSELVDVRVQERDFGAVGLYTRSGTLLLDGSPAVLNFDGRGTIGAESLYDRDPAKRGVGTIQLVTGASTVDLIADNAFRSGEIKGLIDLRDDVLTQAQAQLDSIADAMARALSTKTETGSAATVGAQTGFDLDMSGLQDGDSITLNYTDAASVQHTLTIVRVDEASAPAIGNDYTPRADDTVLAVDFSGGIAGAAADIQAALGASFTVSGSGSTLTILDDGAANTTDVNALGASVTETALDGGDVALPFFVDVGLSTQTYTARHGDTPQMLGFAGRIAVNQSLFDDPGRLVAYDANTAAGDQARPQAILSRLMEDDWGFNGQTGVSGASAFSGSPAEFINRVIAFQGREAETAQRAFDTQSIAYDQLAQRKADASGVDLDEEMAFLISMQTAYQANARVVSVYQEIIDLLLRI